MTRTCDKCGEPYAVGEWPWCPHGVPQNFTVQDDSIPGGMVIENLSPRPQTFYSKSDFKKAMELAGVEQKVQHKGVDGTDKSPHTVRWI